MSLPNLNPFFQNKKPYNEPLYKDLNSFSENYFSKSFIYVLCRNDNNFPIRSYENENDIELINIDMNLYKIVKIPLIKSYRKVLEFKPDFVPYYISDNPAKL